MKYNKDILKNFISYYKPHKKLFILDLSCAFIVALIDLVFPVVTRYVMQTVIPQKNIRQLIMLVAFMLFIYTIAAFLNYIINYWGHILGIRMEYDMRKDLFSHLQTLPFKFYDKNRTGRLMSRMINDLNEITELAHHGPEDLFLSVIMLLGAVIIMFSIEARLALVIFICMPAMIFFGIKKRAGMSEAFKEVKQKIANVNARLENSISGIRVAQSFTNEEYEMQKFDEGNIEFKGAKNKAYKKMSEFITGITYISNVLNTAVLAVGGYFVYKGSMDIADILVFLLYINLVMQPIRRLTQFTQQFESGMTGFVRFSEIMSIKSDITDSENAVELKDIKGDIKIEDVSFSYNEGQKVLKNINLSIKSGQTAALVGPTGGGKTTICHLLPRFYDIDKGNIFIDNINIKDIKINSLRQNIGIVQQDVFLFAGTIRDNISYGRIDASYDEIVEAAKNAKIHDFIISLPDGYNTSVGERGIRLSGGQKQRISIARVFLKNPPILILDEATSSLDNETEQMIQQALDKLSKGRTTLVIAHRLSTVKNADKIIVINNSGIVEQGKHSDLIDKNGIYASLYNIG